MAKEDILEMEGKIVEVLPNQMFKVDLSNNTNHAVLCYMSGRMKKFKIKLVQGDSVKIEVSPYDLSKGRIVLRL